ncbi:cytochrome P450 [Artemisia annua]|uniref:Cytochrome P450 n=1 Tax=Artemisia annua TaxID=35608 RepID=A0A2U1M2K0_ARTAN|nr:cytochrome P450 [Artemisia annua]
MSLLLIIGLLVFFLFRMILNHLFPKERHLPPGPKPWPVIGNLFQLRKNTHVHLAKMARIHGPLMSLRLGHRTVIVGSSSVAACEILKTHDHALSGRDVSILLRNKKPTIHNMNLVFTSECDDGWRVLRNIYGSELFSSKALESRAKMRETKVMEMVEYLASKEGEDIVIKDVAFATAINIIGNTTLSTDLVDFEGNGIGASIMESVRKLTKLAAKPQLVDMFPILGQWDLQGWYKEIMHIVEQDLGSIWKDSLEKKQSAEYIFSGPKDFTDILIDKGFTNQQINPLMQDIK